ncbi:MAG: acyltransferase [Steroidobacteraceae bacterium]|nr:acyltransferase [Steroidobacteraceae bacterium]
MAALIVFLSHAALPDLIPGAFGVTVFFFLSGYLITTLLRREHESTGRIALGSFYLRRVYRILPPMYIVLILAVLLDLTGVFNSQMTLRGVLAQFAHMTNYFMIYFGQSEFAPATSLMWSLAVEEHFYLLFPLALGLLYRHFKSRGIAGVLLAVCGLVLLWRMYLVFVSGYGHEYTYFATDTRVDSLLYGCILGVWRNPALDRSERTPGKRTWIALLAVSIGLLLFTFLYRSESFRESFRYSIQGIALFSLFFCAVRFHHWPIFAWLETRPMRAMGLISYTFYLVHIPCLELLKRHFDLGVWQRTAFAFVLTVAVSTAMYYLVERRMAALRRRLHGRKKPVMSKADPTDGEQASEAAAAPHR